MPADVPRMRFTARSAPISIDNRALETAKWIGLAAMTIDHVNTYLLHGAHAWMYQIGRIAMPLFGIALAAHLASPDALEKNGPAARMTRRLAVFAALAQIPFTLLRGGPWPPTLLNTMFMLLLVVAFVRLRASGQRWHRVVAWTALAVGGAAVEFWWIGAAVVLTVRSWLMEPTAERGLAVAVAIALLCVLTMSAVPPVAPLIVYSLARGRVTASRVRLLFYGYYPLHLAALLALGGGPK
jgi:TraX protein